MAKPDTEGEQKTGGFRVVVSHERVKLPNGHEMWLDIVHHPGAAAVVPFTADGEIALIRQYRHAAGGTILEVPAGKLDAREPPERCAARELAEEAGFRAGRIVSLGSIWTTPGFTDEVIHLYIARDLTAVKQNLDHDEVLTVERVPFTEAIAMIRDGRLVDAKSICALLLAQDRLAAGR